MTHLNNIDNLNGTTAPFIQIVESIIDKLFSRGAAGSALLVFMFVLIDVQIRINAWRLLLWKPYSHFSQGWW